MTEFELIRTYFASHSIARPDVPLGIGDDAAIIAPPAGMELAITTDTLNAGIHFFQEVDPESLGHKSLAVNLSDLAAMGASPAWFLLNLSLPHSDAEWIERFARGLHRLAQRYDVQLVGGDTTRGPLSVTITAVGIVSVGAALRRSGARPGDAVYVTGTLGDAALALAVRRGAVSTSNATTVLTERLERPTPRVAEGIALRDFASSAIDVSDGLLADLSHVLKASDVGARLRLDAIPLSAAYRSCLESAGWDYALAGGDDYELCFTVPQNRIEAFARLADEKGFAVSRIGEITVARSLEVVDATGKRHQPSGLGYDHFCPENQL